jgi:DNA-binding response OmpR family regulator
MPGRPLRILVVDDDPAMVGAINALVGTEGHQVITAYDGLTAVRRFREEHPDLVLLDLAMPGPDGFTVAGQIRAAGSAPIIVVSGESSEGAKVKALGIGADDYLVKPFGRAELLARISAVVPGRPGRGTRSRRAGRVRGDIARTRAGTRRRSANLLLRLTSTGSSRRSPGPVATSSRTSAWRAPAGRPSTIRTSSG